ncbi:MAG: choice-of-anchor J domain-containing protein [Muribaculaceae bacterium]
MKLSGLLLGVLLAVAVPLSAQLSGYADRGKDAARNSIAHSRLMQSASRPLANLPVSERRPMVGRRIAAPHISADLAGVSLREIDPNLNLWGSLIYITLPDGTPIPGRDLGVVSFTPGGDFSTIFSGAGANGGGVFYDGVFYCVKKLIRDFDDVHIDYVALAAFDTETWEQLSFDEVGHELIATDVTHDPVTDNIYGCFYSDDLTKFQFGCVDYKAKTRTTICDLPVALNAIAADKDGTLYAIDLNGNFCTIDKTSGAKTVIGATGFVPYYVTSGHIDSRTGIFWWTVCPESGNSFLCTVDKATGEATKVLDFPNDEEISTLYVPTPLAEDNAPAAVENLDISFPEGRLDGTVSFLMPSTLFAGAPAEGTAAWVVMLNGAVVTQGDAAYGTVVSTNVVSEAGKAKFVVYTANDAGESPRVRKELFIGFGTPCAPANVALSQESNVLSLKWDAVNDAVDGGYVDTENVTYNITRYPGAVEVASDITATEYTETIEIPYDYTVMYYTVEAVNDGKKSLPGKSNSLALGGIHPPYSDDFSIAANLDGWTIEDTNADGCTWTAHEGGFSIPSSYSAVMDDWLFTPGVELEPDKLYKVDFEVHGTLNGAPELIEIMYGNKPESDAMNESVIDTLLIATSQPVSVSGYVTSGDLRTFHVGIHGVSNPFTGGLNVTGFAVSEPVNLSAPNRVSDLELKRGYSTSPLVEISFKAPDTQIDGEDLTSLTKIEISRHDVGVVKVIEAPAFASVIEFADELPSNGYYLYTITPYNEYGAGGCSMRSIQVEAGTPSTPTILTATETSDEGKVKISWDAVSSDTQGFPLENGSVTYTLVEIDGGQQNLVADNLKVTSYTYRAVPRGSQLFKQYAVSAVSKSAESGQKISEMLALGSPYSFPYFESLSGTVNGSIVASSSVSGSGVWQIANDASFTDVTSYDHDDGYFVMGGYQEGDAAQLRFGKVSLIGALNPVLTFCTYNVNTGVEDLNTTTIQVKCDGQWHDVFSLIESEAANYEVGWHRHVVDLSAFTGKTIEVAFTSTIVNYIYTLLDNISIANGNEHDLSLIDLTTPENIIAGKAVDIKADIKNFALCNAEDFSVNLYCNEAFVESKHFDELGAGQSACVNFAHNVNVSYPDNLTYKVVIDYGNDANLADNTLLSKSVQVVKPNLPKVRDFAVSASGNEVSLTWGEPNYSGTSMENRVCDDFENYTSFATENIGDWTLVDADGDKTWSISGIEFPGINKTQPLSYFVLDATLEGLNSTWAAHSGSKYLSNIGSSVKESDDWLISPELCGDAQSVSFFARTYNPYYPESFEFLVSSTTKDINAFSKIDSQQYISADWTEYSYDLPAGTKYFAIRCVSYDAMMFQIDDVNYTAMSNDDITLLGYNVYRNNELVTDTPVSDTAYKAAYSSDSDEFAVSAVYNLGESDVVKGSVSGVESLSTDVIKVVGGKGSIVIVGADGKNVAVYDAWGREKFSGPALPVTSIPTKQGFYLVNVGNLSVKVAVY